MKLKVEEVKKSMKRVEEEIIRNFNEQREKRGFIKNIGISVYNFFWRSISFFFWGPISYFLGNYHFNKGYNLFSSGKFEESLNCFRKTIDISSNHKNAYYYMGLALSSLGRF